MFRYLKKIVHTYKTINKGIVMVSHCIIPHSHTCSQLKREELAFRKLGCTCNIHIKFPWQPSNVIGLNLDCFHGMCTGRQISYKSKISLFTKCIHHTVVLSPRINKTRYLQKRCNKPHMSYMKTPPIKETKMILFCCISPGSFIFSVVLHMFLSFLYKTGNLTKVQNMQKYNSKIKAKFRDVQTIPWITFCSCTISIARKQLTLSCIKIWFYHK